MNKMEQNRLNTVGYKVGFLFRTTATVLTRWLEAYGIGPAQVGILTYVLERGSATQDEISLQQRTDRAATARALIALEKAGFVSRCECPENRRKKLVFPTEKALGIAEELFAVLDRLELLLFTGFTSDEEKTTLDLLDRITANALAELDRGTKNL